MKKEEKKNQRSKGECPMTIKTKKEKRVPVAVKFNAVKCVRCETILSGETGKLYEKFGKCPNCGQGKPKDPDDAELVAKAVEKCKADWAKKKEKAIKDGFEMFRKVWDMFKGDKAQYDTARVVAQQIMDAQGFIITYPGLVGMRYLAERGTGCEYASFAEKDIRDFTYSKAEYAKINPDDIRVTGETEKRKV